MKQRVDHSLMDLKQINIEKKMKEMKVNENNIIGYKRREKKW